MIFELQYSSLDNTPHAVFFDKNFDVCRGNNNPWDMVEMLYAAFPNSNHWLSNFGQYENAVSL